MLTRRKTLLLPIVILCAYFCSCVSTSTLDANNATTDTLPPLRLPTTVLPEMYYLHITTRIHEDVQVYSGNVTIDLAVTSSTNEIVLHAKLLRDYVVTLTDVRNDRLCENIEYSHDNRTEFLRIYSATEPLKLQVGERYRLEILFNGDIQTQHFGFYKAVYKDDENNTIPLATTQFEPTSARLAFPCFDEPSFKSKFIITITHGSNYSALSNMPIYAKIPSGINGELTTTTFLETPIMPTYLLAFVVSNYDHISEFENGIEQRVFFPPNSKNNGRRALKNAIKSLTALENYLGIKYPLPKLDHIRVDKTYGSAMENWGLITYNMKNFIPNIAGPAKHSVLKHIIIQNHEIAHQWFGNLVSPKWWTYSWLNEGFATYFSYIATELVYPDWSIQEKFIEAEVEVTYSWPITRAMTHYVEKESDIKSAFDVVIYQKAAVFIKMFHHAMGQKTFIKGVALYLTKFKYSVADEEDLFEALQEAVDEDEARLFQGKNAVTNMMVTWTHNQGIPIVTVKRNYDEGTVTIRQRSNSKQQNETWYIPLNFATASNPNFDKTTADYIMPPVQEVTINLNDININISNSDWLIVNKQQTGLQHVVYDDHNMRLIASALTANHTQIHKLNRALLFRDLSSAIERELGAIEPVFDILEYLKFEQELMPWNTAADLILDLGANLFGSKAHDMFKAFIRDIIGPSFEKYYHLSKSEIDMIDIFARAKIIDVACQVDHGDCLNFTKTLANQYFYEDVQITDALRDICLCQGLKYATFEEFQKLMDKLINSSTDSEIFDDIIFSIRCIEDPENLKYFLNTLFGENSTHFLMDDFESMQYLAFVYVSNYASRPVIMEFMKDNYMTLCRKKSNVISVALDRISNYVSEDDGQKAEFELLLSNVKQVLHDSKEIPHHKIGSRIKKREHFKRKYENDVYERLKSHERERTARSGDTHRRTRFASARYVVAAGLLSNLIGFV